MRHGVLDIHLAAFGLDNRHGAALIFTIGTTTSHIEGSSGTGVVLCLALARIGDDAVIVGRDSTTRTGYITDLNTLTLERIDFARSEVGKAVLETALCQVLLIEVLCLVSRPVPLCENLADTLVCSLHSLQFLSR